MKLFFFDTETTGVPDFIAPSSAEHQPRIVSVAGILVDYETREVEAAFDLIVRPEGWVIPDDVIAIHGITNERASRVGISESLATEVVREMARLADIRVAHSANFDNRIIRIALKRFMGDVVADDWKDRPSICTAQLARKIMGGKIPKLADAHQYFLGEGFEGAHSALADAEACMRVYFAIKDRGGVP